MYFLPFMPIFMGLYSLFTTELETNDTSFKVAARQVVNILGSGSYKLTFNVFSQSSTNVQTVGSVEAYQRVGEKTEFTLIIRLSDTRQRSKEVQLFYSDNVVYRHFFNFPELCYAYHKDNQEKEHLLLSLLPNLDLASFVSLS